MGKAENRERREKQRRNTLITRGEVHATIGAYHREHVTPVRQELVRQDARLAELTERLDAWRGRPWWRRWLGLS